MNFKRIFGIFFIVCGAALLGGAAYIQILINEGKVQILEGQKMVEDASVLLNIHPLSRRLTKKAEEKAQGKIDAATETVAKYEEIVKYALIGGGSLLIIGTAFVVYSRKKK